MRRGGSVFEFLTYVVAFMFLVAILCPLYHQASIKSSIQAKLAHGESLLNKSEAEFVRTHPTDSTVQNYLKSNTKPYSGAGDSCNIVVILKDGRRIKTAVAVPRGAKVSSVQIAPLETSGLS